MVHQSKKISFKKEMKNNTIQINIPRKKNKTSKLFRKNTYQIDTSLRFVLKKIIPCKENQQRFKSKHKVLIFKTDLFSFNLTKIAKKMVN